MIVGVVRVSKLNAFLDLSDGSLVRKDAPHVAVDDEPVRNETTSASGDTGAESATTVGRESARDAKPIQPTGRCKPFQVQTGFRQVRKRGPQINMPQFVRPVEIAWRNHPALPGGAKIAVLFGDPSEEGKFVLRVRSPVGVRVMPHIHPEDRIYTVLSGVFHIGFGDTFDPDNLQTLPEGSVAFVPKGKSHYQLANVEEYIIQINGIGPTATEYVRAEDDPRTAVSSC